MTTDIFTQEEVDLDNLFNENSDEEVTRLTISDDDDGSESNPSASSESLTPTPAQKQALMAEISGVNSPEEEVTDEPPDLSELEETSRWADQPWIRIATLSVVSGVFVLFGYLIFQGTTSSPQMNTASVRDQADPFEDPTARAIQDAENSKAQLILLGEPLNSPPPASIPSPSPSLSPSPTPSTSPPPSPPPSVPPRRVSTRRVSTPRTPSRPISPRSTPSVATRPTPRPPISTSRTLSAPKPKVDRQALTTRGWSGFIETSRVAQATKQEEATASSVPVQESELTIPVIRLGDPTNTARNWQYQPSISSVELRMVASRSLEPLERSSFVKERLNPKSTFPIGTQLSGKLTTPIIYTTSQNGESFSQPFTLVLSKDLTTNDQVALKAGTTMTGRVIGITPSGMVSAEIVSLAYKKGGKLRHFALQKGQILLLGENRQPLRAQRLNDPSGAIAAQDFLLGTLGAISTGLEYANRPQTQTIISQSGVGFSSNSTTTSGDIDLASGVAEGFFSTLEGRIEQRADRAIQEYQTQIPEYFVPEGTSVTLLINAVLEVN